MKKYKNVYEISRSFYLKLVLYIFATIFLMFFVSYCLSTYFGLSNRYGYTINPDTCNENSPSYDFIVCGLVNSKDSSLYYFYYYGFLILAICGVLGLVLLNVFFIANRFYFKRYVKEYSYGAVIYRNVEGKNLYLIQEMSHGHTSLCKGHQEEGEDPVTTTLREINEETSLSVIVDTGLKQVIRYHPDPNTVKYVTFYVAENKELEQEPIDNHDSEVKSQRFVSYHDAVYSLTYDSDRNVLIKANRYIENKQNKKDVH